MPSAEAFLLGVAALVCLVLGSCLVVVLCDGPFRRGKSGPTLVALVALCSILIIRLPYLFGHTVNEKWAALVPFALAIAWMAPKPKRRVNQPLLLLITGVVALLAIALFRGKSAGVGIGSRQETIAFIGSVALVAIFGVLLFTTARDKTELWWRLVAVALAPAAYVGANVVLHFAGLSTPPEIDALSYAAGTEAKTLALIGIHINREALPMNPSINGMGVIAAVGLAAAVLLAMRTSGPARTAGLAGAGMCLVAVLLTDTRAGIILAIVVVALLKLIKRPRTAVLFAAIIPFSSWILMSTLSFFSSTGLATPIARSARDVSTGNGRTVIWEAAQHQFGTFDIFHTLFGFGANGQDTSGTSRLYSHLFADEPATLLVHVHNFGLQTLMDMGVVGLGVLVLTVVLVLDRLERLNKISPSSPVAALIGAMLMLFLTGATEPSPTYRSQETLVYAMLVIAAAAGLAMRPVEAPIPPLRRRAHAASAPVGSRSGMSPRSVGAEA